MRMKMAMEMTIAMTTIINQSGTYPIYHCPMSLTPCPLSGIKGEVKIQDRRSKEAFADERRSEGMR